MGYTTLTRGQMMSNIKGIDGKDYVQEESEEDYVQKLIDTTVDEKYDEVIILGYKEGYGWKFGTTLGSVAQNNLAIDMAKQTILDSAFAQYESEVDGDLH